MTKAKLFWLLATVLLVTVSAEAQQPKKVVRIGVLSPATWSTVNREVFKQGLRELGYVEGQNIVFELRSAEGNPDRFPELAAELVRLNPDIIITSSTSGARAVKYATTTIPIVVTGAGDLVGRGIVASLARPGGNITGFTSISPQLSGKWLELLKEVIPRARRVAFLYRPGEEDELKEVEAAGEAFKIKIQRLMVQQSGELNKAYAAMVKERADAVVVSRNPLTGFHRKQISDLAIKNRLPAMCEGNDFVNDGCLMSYARDPSEGWRLAAGYVDKILKSTKPADLPVQQPTKFDLIFNLKTAKQIGLTIPPNVLVRADKVIR